MSCASTETWQVGDRPRLRGSFKDDDGVLINPDGTITFKVRDPSGNVTTYVHGTNGELVHESTGVYGVDTILDESGTWFYRWAASGATADIVAAGEATFTVETSVF